VVVVLDPDFLDEEGFDNGRTTGGRLTTCNGVVAFSSLPDAARLLIASASFLPPYVPAPNAAIPAAPVVSSAASEPLLLAKIGVEFSVIEGTTSGKIGFAIGSSDI